MARRIVFTDKADRRVAFDDEADRRISMPDVSQRLGADAEEAAPSAHGSPLSFLSVREEVARRLRSSGGRPGLEGAERKKISMPARDWELAETYAAQMAEPGFNPSPGQVVGVLASMLLRQLTTPVIAEAKRELIGKRRNPRRRHVDRGSSR